MPRSMILVGPGKHFGAEVIRRFAREGFSIGVLSPRRESQESLRHDVADLGGRIRFAVADVTDMPAFRDRMHELAEQLGGVECLIYNPKLSVDGTGLDVAPSDLAHTLAVNVTGALVAIQAIIPILEQARNPNVIITSGGYKNRPDSGKFALSVGKASLHSLFELLKTPLKKKGIQLKTVVIDGAVRRAGKWEGTSDNLADFYWQVFADRGRHIYKFPQPPTPDNSHQLRLPV